MRPGRYFPVCLLLAVWGCRQGGSSLHWREEIQDWRADLAQAMRFEGAEDVSLEALSLRVFLEDRRPHFSTIKPEKVARTWERKLRTLDLAPRRSDRIVAGRTPKGLEFELVFWTESSVDTGGKDLTVGELLWRHPEDAGRGVEELLGVEKRRREAKAAQPGGKKKER